MEATDRVMASTCLVSPGALCLHTACHQTQIISVNTGRQSGKTAAVDAAIREALGQPLPTAEQSRAMWIEREIANEEADEMPAKKPAEKPTLGELSKAMRAVEVYHNSNGLDLTCGCGIELIPPNESTTRTLLELVQKALSHRHECTLTQRMPTPE